VELAVTQFQEGGFFMIRTPKQIIVLISILVTCFAAPFLAIADEGEMKHMKHMMKKEKMTVVHLSTEDPDAASMAMSLATQLRKTNKKVLVFLDVKGVKVGVGNPPPALQEANTKVREFIDQAGRVIVCRPCLQKMGVKEADLLPGAEFSHPEKMSKIFTGGTTVIDY
jgi:predicted peroxiredoxin